MLTDAQKTDVRRWLGYPTLNAGEPDYVYGSTPSSISLNAKLDTITAQEQDVLINQFLTPLLAMENALSATIDDMDMQQAGPWIANPKEMSDRHNLFSKWRRNMAGFLGFPPGPALGSGGISLVRC